METLASEHRETVRRIVGGLKGRPGPLIEVLHAIQGELGFVPPAAVPLVAAELNLSRAEVHGVVTFYHFFRSTAPGAHTVSVCRAESCQAVGGEALAAHARQQLSRLPPDHAGRALLARAGLLPGQLRLLAGGDDRWTAAWQGDSGALRRPALGSRPQEVTAPA